MYYQDCQLRSLHNQPTQHLAFIDLDEYFLPTYLVTPTLSWTPLSANLSRNPLSTFLTSYLRTLDQNVSSVCFDRQIETGPPVPLLDLVSPAVACSSSPELAYVSMLSDLRDEPKCIHHIGRNAVGAVQ